MSKDSRIDEENRLIKLLVEHDESMDSGTTDSNIMDSFESGQQRLLLANAKECLEKLQSYASRNSFPGDVKTANSDTSKIKTNNDSTIKQNIGEQHANSQPEQDEKSERLAAKRTLEIPEYIGRFKIIKQIGIGGFGIVLHAVDPELQREVALKILRPESLLTESARLRFKRESQLAATLDHPAIVPVHETGIDGPIRYIVFGFINGESLADWLDRFSQPLESKSTAAIMTRITEAVACAHDHEILHRDLKPGNLLIDNTRSGMLTSEEELASRIHVADFGLAIDLEGSSSLTQTGRMMGTPIYIAPEMISGNRRPSKSSDVYSLGVIMFELLTGQTPFKSNSGIQLLREIVENDPPRINSILAKTKSESLSNKRTSVCRDLEAICFRCLQKDPLQRYANAGELLSDLRRWQIGEPVNARPVTTWSRAVRWLRGRPMLAGLLGTVLALMLLLAIGGTWTAIELAHRNSELRKSWFDSLVIQSQSAQTSLNSGRRNDATTAIRSAAELLTTFSRTETNKLVESRRLQLRNEAISNMTVFDIKIANSIPLPQSASRTAAEICFDDNINLVAFPDGKNGIAIFDCLTATLKTTLPINGTAVEQLGFIPNSDLLFAVVSQTLGDYSTGNLCVWNLSSAKPANEKLAFQLKNVDSSFVTSVAEDGKSLVCLNTTGILRWVNLMDESSLELELPNQPRPEGAAFSPSGSFIAIWKQNRIDIWDTNQLADRELSDGPKLSLVHRFNSKLKINSVAWSSDEERLAATNSVFSTHVWSLPWGASQHQELAGHTSWVYHGTFDPNNKFIVTASADATTRFWNCETGELLLVAPGQATSISDNGQRIGAINKDSIEIWNVLTPAHQQTVRDENCFVSAFSGQASLRGMMAFSNETHMCVQGLSNGEFLWERETTGGLDVAISGNGEFAFFTDIDQVIRVDLSSLEEVVFYERSQGDQDSGITINSLSVNHDGAIATVTLCDGVVKTVFEPNTAAAKREIRFESQPVFHPLRNQFVVAQKDCLEFTSLDVNSAHDTSFRIRYSDIENSAGRFELVNTTGETNIRPIKFDHCGKLLVVQLNESPAILNLEDHTLHQIAVTNETLDYYDFAFSADNRFLAVSGINQSIHLYGVSPESENLITKVATFPVGTSNTWVTFATDSKKIVSSDSEQRMYLWNLSELRRELQELGLDWAD